MFTKNKHSDIPLTLVMTEIMFQVVWVSSHGQLWKPASRNTAWRVGFNTPADYNDMETHCGGAHFDALTPRTCNICGGPPGTGKNVRDRYATGTITAEYRSGGTIALKYKATANHKGYFLVKLCVSNTLKHVPPQSCFDK